MPKVREKVKETKPTQPTVSSAKGEAAEIKKAAEPKKPMQAVPLKEEAKEISEKIQGKDSSKS